MLGVNLENTTSDQFQLSLTGRYLRFDVFGSGSELRLDAVAGADPSLPPHCIGRSGAHCSPSPMPASAIGPST